jgi:hypothetical protein
VKLNRHTSIRFRCMNNCSLITGCFIKYRRPITLFLVLVDSSTHLKYLTLNIYNIYTYIYMNMHIYIYIYPSCVFHKPLYCICAKVYGTVHRSVKLSVFLSLWFRKHQLERLRGSHRAPMITRTWWSLHSTCRALARKLAQV